MGGGDVKLMAGLGSLLGAGRLVEAAGLKGHRIGGAQIPPRHANFIINIENARARFPNVRFKVGNAFELHWPDKAFDYCVVHDLFEHLSLEGLHTAVREVCRVTRQGLCVSFFHSNA